MTDSMRREAEQVIEMAEEIFGDKDKALRWLQKPKRRLHGRSPEMLLATEEGTKQVEEMLLQLKYGFTA